MAKVRFTLNFGGLGMSLEDPTELDLQNLQYAEMLKVSQNIAAGLLPNLLKLQSEVMFIERKKILEAAPKPAPELPLKVVKHKKGKRK